MRPRPTTRALALAALAGLLYWAAQPPLAVGSLAFVALVPLLLEARAGTAWRGLALGWIAGTIACNGLTSASIHAALLRAHHPGWLAAAEALVIPQLCGALYFAAFGAYVAVFQHRHPGTPWRIVVLPAAWIAGELARSRIGHGMPWVLLAHAAIDYPSLLQVADVTGAYGISFVVALVNVLACMLVEEAPAGWPRLRLPLAFAGGVLAVVVAYGHVQLARWREPAGTPIRTALIQGDIPAEWRTSMQQLPAVLSRYRDLVGEAARGRPDLVVLPENAAGVSPTANPHVLARIAEPLAGSDARLLLGAPRPVSLGAGRATVRNSAFLVDGAGTLLATYDKLHLVPFGETSSWLLPAPVQRRLGLRDDYSAGDAGTLFDVAGTRVGVLICWEGIYAGAARALARDGAELLVNLSNDDWFGGHAAVEQHFRATLLRAVETRRVLLRATNSGITAVVDPRGVVVAAAPAETPVVLPAQVTALSGSTLSVRIGDAFAWACVAIAVGGLLVRRSSAT